MRDQQRSLLLELNSILDRYSDEEIGRAIRTLVHQRISPDSSVAGKGSLIRSNESKLPSPKSSQHYLPRLLSGLPHRDLRLMSLGELRRLARLTGVEVGPKDSRTRIIGKLKKSSPSEKGLLEPESRPQLGEYEGWVKMIVKNRGRKRP